MADIKRNKETVRAYCRLAFNDKQPVEAVSKYVSPKYIQHNPLAPTGAEAFIRFVTSIATRFPQSSLEIKHAIAEGDFVVTHSLLKISPEDRGTVGVDIFRLEDRKVVEHWDVLQPEPETASNNRSRI